MERMNVIATVINLIKTAFEENNYQYVNTAFNECCDYNFNHPESEIYMAEDVNYIAVEDDMFYFDETMF